MAGSLYASCIYACKPCDCPNNFIFDLKYISRVDMPGVLVILLNEHNTYCIFKHGSPVVCTALALERVVWAAGCLQWNKPQKYKSLPLWKALQLHIPDLYPTAYIEDWLYATSGQAKEPLQKLTRKIAITTTAQVSALLSSATSRRSSCQSCWAQILGSRWMVDGWLKDLTSKKDLKKLKKV